MEMETKSLEVPPPQRHERSVISVQGAAEASTPVLRRLLIAAPSVFCLFVVLGTEGVREYIDYRESIANILLGFLNLVTFVKTHGLMHIANHTLTSGVAIGTIAPLNVGAGGAVLVGTIAGIVSVLGYRYISPYLKPKGLYGTCGVGNLHTKREGVLETTDILEIEASRLNNELAGLSAEERIQHVLNYARSKGKEVVQTTSFGIQSALMIDLSNKAGAAVQHRVPIVWIDTGYLPSETYGFAKFLTDSYDIDLRLYQPACSTARMEALYGKLWENPSDEAHKTYNLMRKVEPMQRALQETNATIVMSGLRASQTQHRQQLKIVNVQDGRLKICPILDWTDQQVQQYFAKHDLPYHPLRQKGYRSVGDWHSSQPFDPSIHKSERETRFHGRTQECGLHLSVSSLTSLESSSSLPALAPLETGFVLYGKPACKYCRAAKTLLERIADEIDDTIVMANEFEVGKDISKEDLEHVLGRSVKTVPQILYKGTYVGGYDSLVAWGRQMYPEKAFSSVLDQIVVD